MTPTRVRLRALRHQYGAVVLFSAAVVLLIALGAWWFVFLTGAIDTERHLSLLVLRAEANVELTRRLAAAPGGPVSRRENDEVGLACDHPVFQSTLASPSPLFGLRVMPVPGASGRCRLVADASAEALARIEVRHQRRRGMVLGEGMLLTSLLIAVVAMLFQLVRGERRFRLEMTDFLGRVTHEMKTPLAGIKAVLQTIQAGRMPAEQQTELVSMALREVEREEHLVQNLLLAQRMRMPDQRLGRDDVPLRPLLDRFAEHRAPTLAMDGIELGIACPPGLHVLADPTAVWTILENLADNAIKYGGRHLQLEAAGQGRRVQLQLHDDGMGFDPARGATLFQPFSRSAGPAVARHGTGLGLHLSRALAERMGGRLEARSEGEGRGATFILTLPVP